MLKDVIRVQALEDHQLVLNFEDGVRGIVDVKEIIEFTGVFQPLKDPDYFMLVRVNSELGTIYWPNDADIDPDVLYSLVSGEPIPDFVPEGTESHGD